MVKNLGQMITPAREKLDLSMHECARRIDVCPFYWHQIERNKEVPSSETLKKLCNLLGLDYELANSKREETKKNIKEHRAKEKAAEKRVVLWMRNRKKDPNDVLDHLIKEFGL
jgi:ribosome-binding protein aMBF1 (putative translation factor)